MEQTEKKVIFSGIQPSGSLTIGNYIGALKNFSQFQDEFNCIYCVVDMHAITVRQDPAKLRQRTKDLTALYLACGLDPEKSILFVQSHVPAHAELGWVLNNYTYLGELSRMTQYKDKSKKAGANVNAGLLNYPVLMAADILLYQAALVPVGVDQKQHLELARDVAIRFNNAYSPTFVVPEGYIPKSGAKVMSLQNPTAKMSKSDDDENASVFLSDTPDAIVRKFKRAVTDSGNEIVAREDKPGITNLLTIYAAFKGITVEEAEKDFAGVGYGAFKEGVAEAVIEKLAPIQKRQSEILADKTYLESVMKSGSERANYLARKTLSKVYRKIGFVTL